MSAIIIPRKHYTQPQGRVEVAPEWAGQLSHAAIWGDIPDYDLADGEPLELVNNTGSVTTEVGTAGRASYVKHGIAASVSRGPVFSNGDLTAIFVVDFVERSNRCAVLSQKSSSSSIFGLNFDSNHTYVASRVSVTLLQTGVNRSHAYAPITLDGRAHACLFRKRGTSAQWFIDGAAVLTTASGGFTGSPFTVSDTVRILGDDTDSSYSSARPVYLTAVARKAFSDNECVSLTINPWQLFRADPVRIYSLPSGAISINSITASNITQSSARITLGLTR